MRFRKQDIFARFHKLPRLRFEDQQLTSFAGAIVFQLLFRRLDLKNRLKSCFPAKSAATFAPHVIVWVLIVHLLLGFRRLRDVDYYRDDPVVLRLLGLRRLPDVATISRALAKMGHSSIEKVRHLSSTLVVQALRRERFPRLTLDFDGSVSSTCGHAEGTAVGYNPKKKGARSYYNLFCTVAQTGQFFDVLHRPGNVHDSKDAHVFMMDAFRSRARRTCAPPCSSRDWTAPSSATTRLRSWTCMASNARSVSPSNAFPYSRTKSKRAGAGAISMSTAPISRRTGNPKAGRPC